MADGSRPSALTCTEAVHDGDWAGGVYKTQPLRDEAALVPPLAMGARSGQLCERFLTV